MRWVGATRTGQPTKPRRHIIHPSIDPFLLPTWYEPYCTYKRVPDGRLRVGHGRDEGAHADGALIGGVACLLRGKNGRGGCGCG